jgi:hypothetical protein
VGKIKGAFLENRINRLMVIVMVVLFSLTLVSVPLYDFSRNIFGWHFQQPDFVQGGIELLSILIFLFVCGFASGTKWKYLLLIAITEAYLRRHNVDVALLIAFLYAESLIGLGYYFYKDISIYKIPSFFIFGACLFVLFSMALSLINLARMDLLIGLACIPLALFYLTSFRNSLLYKLYSSINEIYLTTHLTRFVYLLLYVCLLMVAAKTAYGISYDEIWYSLRLNEDLNINGSFFEDLKLLGNWVHEYPKFFEILIFPLQLFQSYTVSRIFTVMVLGVGLIAAHEFWEGHQLSTRQRSLLSVVLISIPVVVGIAASAKADFFAAFIFLVSVFYFLNGVNQRDLGFILNSIALLVLTLAIKLSAFPYVIVFFLLYLYVAIASRNEFKRPNWGQIRVLILFVATFAVVTCRTLYITGVPIVGIADMSSSISTIYELLGLKYKYPYGPVESGVLDKDKIDSLKLLFNIFVFPSGVRQVFCWISNISIPFTIMAIIWSVKYRRARNEALLVVLSFFLMVCIIGLIFNNKREIGGDGNYYLMSLMVIITIGAIALRLIPNSNLPIIVMCSIYIVGNLPIAFVSSPSWHIGTRGFDLVFNEAPFDKSYIRNQEVASNGLLDVRNYLAGLDQSRCVALAESGNYSLYFLGCRTEVSTTIIRLRPYLLAKEDGLFNFLKEKKVTHLVVQNYFPNSYLGRLCRLLINAPDAKVSRFEYYDVIDIQNVKDIDLKQLSILAAKKAEYINLDESLPHTIRSLTKGNELTSNGVELYPARQGIRGYYSRSDNVILIKPDTAIEFLVKTNGRCIDSLEAYYSNHIQPSGALIPSGKFVITVLNHSNILNEQVFNFNGGNHLQGKIEIDKRLDEIKVIIKFEPDGIKLDPNLQGVIINPHISYCN